MTSKELKKAVRYLGLVASFDGDEWRVRIPGNDRADYFTSCRMDALGTAVGMYMRREGIPESDRLAKAGYFYGKALEYARS